MSLLVACDKKADATPAAGSDPTATAAAAKSAPTTVKLADLKKAYKSEFDDMSKSAIPIPKKVEAFIAQVGKPASDTGRTKTWFAADGAQCSKVVIDSSDGSMTEESTANSDCGM
jgi:hypothetical protein